MSEVLEPEDPGQAEDAGDLGRSLEGSQAPELPSLHQNHRLSARYEYQSEFISPFPPPNVMKGYEEAIPGSAERIIVMAEKEQAHQHAMQEKLVNAQTNDLRQSRIENRYGQWFGFIIGMTVIGLGGYSVLQGKQLSQQLIGGFVGTAGVGGLVSIFVIGRKAEASQKNIYIEEEE